LDPIPDQPQIPETVSLALSGPSLRDLVLADEDDRVQPGEPGLLRTAREFGRPLLAVRVASRQVLDRLASLAEPVLEKVVVVPRLALVPRELRERSLLALRVFLAVDLREVGGHPLRVFEAAQPEMTRLGLSHAAPFLSRARSSRAFRRRTR